MARARVQLVEGAERTTFTYHLPVGWFTPAVWLWCLLGGLPVGIGAALATRAANDYPRLVRTVLVGVTIVVAGALYALYVLSVQRLALHITFDRARSRVGFRQVSARRWTWYPRSSVEGFRLVREPSGARLGCALVMDTRDSALTLVQVSQDCYAQSGLPHLVTRLNTQLQLPPRDVLADIPHPERVVPPPARSDRDPLDEPPNRESHLPTPPDAHD